MYIYTYVCIYIALSRAVPTIKLEGLLWLSFTSDTQHSTVQVGNAVARGTHGHTVRLEIYATAM